MARRSAGWEALEFAQEQLRSPASVEALRIAQAVVLPLQLGLTLEQTGRAIGASAAWVARKRRDFIAAMGSAAEERTKKPRGGRRNQLLEASEEDAFMMKVCDDYVDLHKRWLVQINGGKRTVTLDQVWQPVRHYVQQALVEKVGRQVPMSSVYNLMCRTAARKFGHGSAKEWTLFFKRSIWN